MLHTIAGIALKLAGWSTAMQEPPARKCVMLAVPHTSNWDFVFFMLHKWYFRLPRLYWLGKHTLFKSAFGGWFFRSMGGLPVDRRKPGALVQELSEMMQSGEDFILLVAPEGTRYRSRSWKTGFYYIAQEAGVPIVPSILDYGKKRTEFGEVISPDTPLEDIIQNLSTYYHPTMAKFPEHYTSPSLTPKKTEAVPSPQAETSHEAA